MTVTLDHDGIRADTARHVAKLMAAAAITAPKSGGQRLLQGKHLFIEVDGAPRAGGARNRQQPRTAFRPKPEP